MKKFVGTIPELSKETVNLYDEFSKESDRGAALIVSAFLDDTLEAMLRAKMVDCPRLTKKLLKHPGPITTYAAKTDLAYALGLIGPKMHRALHKIREIRNEFAHSRNELSFSNSEISKHCEQLELPMIDTIYKFGSRDRFMVASSILLQQLLVRAHSIKNLDEGKDFATAEVVR